MYYNSVSRRILPGGLITFWLAFNIAILMPQPMTRIKSAIVNAA